MNIIKEGKPYTLTEVINAAVDFHSPSLWHSLLKYMNEGGMDVTFYRDGKISIVEVSTNMTGHGTSLTEALQNFIDHKVWED